MINISGLSSYSQKFPERSRLCTGCNRLHQSICCGYIRPLASQ